MPHRHAIAFAMPGFALVARAACHQRHPVEHMGCSVGVIVACAGRAITTDKGLYALSGVRRELPQRSSLSRTNFGVDPLPYERNVTPE